MSETEGFEQAAVVATLKGGAGYDAPWLVFRSNTADEANNLLEAAANGDLLNTTASAAAAFQQAYRSALPEAPQTAAASPGTAQRPPLTGQAQGNFGSSADSRVFKNAAGYEKVALVVPPPWKNKTAKDEVKALGARFNGDTSTWEVDVKTHPDWVTKFAGWLD